MTDALTTKFSEKIFHALIGIRARNTACFQGSIIWSAIYIIVTSNETIFYKINALSKSFEQ